NALAIVLAAAFAAGALVHFIGPRPLRDAYRGWGYPPGFHYVTALLHVTTAGLLLWRPGRIFAVAIAIGVSIAALATLVKHGEWKKTPTSVALVAALVAVVL